jgi:hypothetical protein
MPALSWTPQEGSFGACDNPNAETDDEIPPAFTICFA